MPVVSPSSWIRPVVLAVSCLVLGFVGGWALANVGGDELSLPDANVDVTVEQPAPKTNTLEAQTPVAPARDTIAVSVLNGTTRPGFAATTAETLKSRGYTKVTSGNTATQTGPTVVYYREGAQAAAEQLVADLQSGSASAIDGTPLAQSTPADTQLVVVLGT